MNTGRDRYTEATIDMTEHIGEKIMGLIRTPKLQAQIQSILDPIVSGIIQRVFPYILLSAILFLILFILTIATFWKVFSATTILKDPAYTILTGL